MFKGSIADLIIIVLIAFSTTVKANQNDVALVKAKTTLVSYGLDLDGFEDALLAKILSYQKPHVIISRYSQWLPRGREFALMSKHQGIDIVWGSATNARFDSYRPIKIPIYKGLIGWRLGLVKQTKQQIFKDVSTLADLRAFIPGQHQNWSDYQIYKENGFNITSGASRNALAEMLVRDRFDYFPRAVIEIEKELRDFNQMDITLDPYLLIRYKSAYVFYVAKDNLELAEILDDGLHRAKADGSFDSLFESYFKALFERLDLPNRRIIQLNNPLLPKEMLDINEHFWISSKALFEKTPPKQ